MIPLLIIHQASWGIWHLVYLRIYVIETALDELVVVWERISNAYLEKAIHKI